MPDVKNIIDELRTKLSEAPRPGEYSSQLEDYLRGYLAAERPITDLLLLPPTWGAPIRECLCGVGDYSASRLGVMVKIRCESEKPVWVETGKRVVPPPPRTARDGAFVKGRGISRSIHLSVDLVQGDEIELDPFYAIAALRAHCASCWPEAIRASSSSIPSEDRLVEVSYTATGAAGPVVVKKSQKKGKSEKPDKGA